MVELKWTAAEGSGSLRFSKRVRDALGEDYSKVLPSFPLAARRNGWGLVGLVAVAVPGAVVVGGVGAWWGLVAWGCVGCLTERGCVLRRQSGQPRAAPRRPNLRLPALAFMP